MDEIRYEVGNALGRLRADQPKLSYRVDITSYARAVRLMLNAIDLYCQRYEIVGDDARRRVLKRCELRCNSHGAVLVMP